MTLSPSARERAISLLSPAVLLIVWEVLADLHVIDPRFFPPPSSIAGALVKLARSGELWANLSASLGRLFWGYLLGGIPALLLGLDDGIVPTGAGDAEPADRGDLSDPEKRDFTASAVGLRIG